MTQPKIQARTTMYKGIRMRSRLEADFAGFLDRSGAEWEYEPLCFAGPDGQWLPDFRVTYNEDRIYFEIKPESLLEGDVDAVLTQMTVAWLTEPGAILQLMVWVYDDPSSSYTFMGFPPGKGESFTWWCGQGSAEMTAWPGMGQLEQAIEEVRREREAAEQDGPESS